MIKEMGLKLSLRVLLSSFRTPRDITRFAFRRYGPRTALISPRGRQTYAELENRVLRLVGALDELGLRPGDTVFTLLRDDWEQIEVRLAAAEMGLVFAGYHQTHSAEKIRNAATKLAARAFIFDPAIAEETLALMGHLTPKPLLIDIGTSGEYERLISKHRKQKSRAKLAAADPAIFGLTSGTSGEGKAIFLTNEVILSSMRLMIRHIHVKTGQIDTFVLGVPLVGAGSSMIHPHLLAGAAIVIPQHYEMRELARLVAEHKATRIFLTPSLLADMLDLPESMAQSLASLQNVIYGTEATPAAKIAEAVRRFGPIFQQGYGMAEVMPPVALLHAEEHQVHGSPAPANTLSSVGHIVPGVSVRIVDENDQSVAQGQVGEVVVQSPTVFSGYWERPDLTKRMLVDGAFHTNDFGYFDENNRLHILNRRGDLIERNNTTLYPRRVEEIAHRHPAIKEACLVQNRDQMTVLCISLRSAWRDKDPQCESDVEDTLTALLTEACAPEELPDRIRIFDALPRSYLAKVLRTEIREIIQ